jgi:hypothetical protein
MRAEVAAKVPPSELRLIDGEWIGQAQPVPGMFYACERDEAGRWWLLFGPYATAEEAEDRADAENYGAAGGWVVVYSADAEADAEDGLRPFA